MEELDKNKQKNSMEDKSKNDKPNKSENVSTSELVNKVYKFCITFSKNELFEYQAQFAKRIIRSLLENDGEEITALFSRQSGKSETVACVAGGCAVILPILANMPMFLNDKRLKKYQLGFLIGIFGPAQIQSQIVFNRIKDNLSSNRAVLIMNDPEVNVRFGTYNGQNLTLNFANLNIYSQITCMSASENSNIEGKSYQLIVVDEAQDVSNFKYKKSIAPMAAFYNGTKILIGTPTTFRGFFYEAIERNIKDYANKLTKKNHFQNDWRVVCQYNSNYQMYVEGEKRRYGEDSDEFQMAYNLKWIFEHGMFVDPDKFDKEPIALPNVGRVTFDTTKVHVVGIDCGKKSDSTVVTVGEVDWDNPIIIEQSPDPNTPDYIVYDVIVKDWLEIQGDNWESQYHQIIEYLRNFKIERIVIDATGVGSPIADRLAVNVSCEVIPYVFTMASRSEMFKHFDSQIKQGRFHYPADENTRLTREYQRFQEQFIDLEKSYNGQHMICCHPDERNAHDDYPFSAGLMVWGARGDVAKPETTKGNPFLEKNQSSFYSTRNNVTAKRRR